MCVLINWLMMMMMMMIESRNPCLHLAIYGVNAYVLSGVFICDTWGIPLFSVFRGGNEEIGKIPYG